MPSGCKRGSSSSKKREEVDRGGGGEWGLRVGGWGRRRFSKLPATHFFLPSIHEDGAGDSDGAIRMDDAQCFVDESFRQRCHDNVNVLNAPKNQRWPTSGQIGYITPIVEVVPNTSQ